MFSSSNFSGGDPVLEPDPCKNLQMGLGGRLGRKYTEWEVVSCSDHASHEENGLVNQVEFLGPITDRLFSSFCF